MVIRYADGSYVDGVIHKLEGGTLRAVVAGLDDAVEFTLVRDEWISESGNAVTFEFPLKSGVRLLDIMPAMIGEGAGHCAAGGDCVLRRASNPGSGLPN
jgi:hypothetical protein